MPVTRNARIVCRPVLPRSRFGPSFAPAALADASPGARQRFLRRPTGSPGPGRQRGKKADPRAHGPQGQRLHDATVSALGCARMHLVWDRLEAIVCHARSLSWSGVFPPAPGDCVFWPKLRIKNAGGGGTSPRPQRRRIQPQGSLLLRALRLRTPPSPPARHPLNALVGVACPAVLRRMKTRPDALG